MYKAQLFWDSASFFVTFLILVYQSQGNEFCWVSSYDAAAGASWLSTFWVFAFEQTKKKAAVNIEMCQMLQNKCTIRETRGKKLCKHYGLFCTCAISNKFDYLP